MCLVSTPLYSCSHAGRRRVYGEPCARSAASRVDSKVASSAASVSSSGSANDTVSSCNYALDYGVHNESSLCPKCIAGGQAMTLSDMLGAVKASVQAARAGSRAGSEAGETSGVSFGDVEGAEVSTDVPDLGPLTFLGTDRRGREVAETVNLHWRAYAKQF
jgi:hypothetical protein